MTDEIPSRLQPLRVASVIGTTNAGGVGSVCRYAAIELARITNWDVTLVRLHDSDCTAPRDPSGFQSVCLGYTGSCSLGFLEWLKDNPQDVIITSDVSTIESSFPFFAGEICHIIQIHDSLKRYREVAVRNSRWVNGVTCVGKHIEDRLFHQLKETGFCGLLGTVHNGANFPPYIRKARSRDQPMRLLFMGRLDPIKGVFYIVSLLDELRRIDIPTVVTIVGGESATLTWQLRKKDLLDQVVFTGRIPHEECYDLASKSDVFLMLSRKEPFGMVTIEAMSMGCLPIGYNTPSGTTEIIEDGVNGILVPLGRITEAAQRIGELHRDRSKLDLMSKNAVSRAREDFSANTMALNLVQFIEETVLHSRKYPAQRISGLPKQQPKSRLNRASMYQRLPLSVRERIRALIGSHPRFCYWYLNR